MKKTMLKILRALIFYTIIVAVWYLVWYVLVHGLAIIKGDRIVSPQDVYNAFIGLVFRNTGGFWNHMLASIGRLFLGYTLSILIGAVLAGMMFAFKIFKDDMRALLSGIQSLPNMCWIPFAIILCGINPKSIYFVIILGSAPSIALAIESSIRNIDPIYTKAGRTLGCNKIGMCTRIYIPASMPSTIAGLRQGWAFSWRALMTGEMNLLFSIASKGIGYFMYTMRTNAQLDKVICIMIILILVGVFFEKIVFGIAENKILTKRGIRREKTD